MIEKLLFLLLVIQIVIFVMEKPDHLELHSHKEQKRNILFFESGKTLPTMQTVRKYPISCANIDQIQIIETHTGSGRSKTSNIGIFNGSKVVIKRLSDIQKVIGYDTAHMFFYERYLNA